MVGCEDAMKEALVLPRGRNEGQNALQQLAAREPERGGTVGPGCLQPQEDGAIRLVLETLPAQRGARDVPGEPLQSDPISWSHVHPSMEVEAVAHGAPGRQLVHPLPVDLDALGPSAGPLTQRGTPRGRGGLEQALGIIGIGIVALVVLVVLVVLAEALLGQPALAALGDLDGQVLDVACGGREDGDEAQPPLLVAVPGAVGDEAVEVRVEGQGAAEALDLGDGSAAEVPGPLGGRPSRSVAW